MITVHKYPVEFADNFTLKLPVGAKVLDCQMQNGSMCMWALVDTEASLVERKFRLAGSGHLIKNSAGSLVHVSTFQPQVGLVFHLFEILYENSLNM